MEISAFLAIAMGFFGLYCLSSRAKYKPFRLSRWINEKQTIAKPLSWFSIVIGTMLFMLFYGIGVGLFYCLIVAMLFASIQLIYFPLKKSKK